MSVNRGYRVVVFDVDGTLVDSVPSIVWSMCQAAKECGAPVPSKEAVLDIIGITLRQAVGRLFPMCSEEENDRITDMYRKLNAHREDTEPSPLFPGIREALGRLRERGSALAIATGKSRRGLERFFAFEGTRELVDFSVCGDQAPSKPDPGMLELVLSHFGLERSEILMVGDSSLDLRMATNARVDAAGVTTGAHSPAILRRESPVFLEDSVVSLAERLLAEDCIMPLAARRAG